MYIVNAQLYKCTKNELITIASTWNDEIRLIDVT